MEEPIIAVKPGFKVIGIEFCIDIKTADYKQMWNDFLGEKGKLRSVNNGNGDYGLFHRVCEDGRIGYLLGVESDDISKVPGGFTSLSVEQAQYAVLECNADTVGEAWPFIHGVWLPNSKEYAMAKAPAFEFYPPQFGAEHNTILIHIPVRKKERKG